MKPKEMKRLESYLRKERINESSNGRTLSTRVQMDEKKTYNRQKEKRNLNDSSYFVYNELFIKTTFTFSLLSFRLVNGFLQCHFYIVGMELFMF